MQHQIAGLRKIEHATYQIIRPSGRTRKSGKISQSAKSYQVELPMTTKGTSVEVRIHWGFRYAS